MTALFNTPFGAFALQRYPARRGEPLLAWCSADSLLLKALHSLQLPAGRTLVVNDEHGALSVPLQPVGLWTDSALASIALDRNLRANKLDPVTVTWSTQVPPGKPTCALLFPDREEDFSFFHGDGLLDYPGEPAPLILCNPPFHHQHAVDEFVGRRLLAQCGRHLGGGGRLCVVANRHLDYGPTLRRHFDRVERFAQNPRFIVWLARKS